MSFIKETKQYMYLGSVTTIGVLLVTEGWFGEGLFGAVAIGAAAGLSLVAGLIVYVLGKRDLAKGFFANALVFLLGAVIHIAAVKTNAMIAHRRLDQVASAAESYRAKYGKDPETLNALVPEFIAKIPRAKYTLLWGNYYLADNKIMCVGPMSFMTTGYDMRIGKIVFTGYEGMISILRLKSEK